MSLGEHLEELRRRLLYALAGLAIAAVLSLLLGERLIEWLRQPYAAAMTAAGRDPSLHITRITSAFTTYLKVSLIFGLVLASPWVFYQLWMFVAAGLYPREKRYVLFAAPACAALFAAGALFYLFVVAEGVLKFFLFFSDWLEITPIVTLDTHVSMMTTLMLVFGLGFQTPLAVLLLERTGLVTLSDLNRYRRHVVVAVVVLAAVLTPPDVISQVCLGVPLWLLYELGVLLAWISRRRRRRAEL
jgi:sec-independent protein translocase protein TatC